MYVEAEVTIVGGLPVIVTGEICRAEPDVGIMNEYIDDVEFFWTNGKPIPSSLEERISIDDHERAITSLFESRD